MFDIVDDAIVESQEFFTISAPSVGFITITDNDCKYLSYTLLTKGPQFISFSSPKKKTTIIMLCG